jgi:hypothetical protein
MLIVPCPVIMTSQLIIRSLNALLLSSLYVTLPLLSTTLQLSITSTRDCRIIRLQHTRLTLIRLTKRISTLFAHTLYLSDFSNSLLKLFHSIKHISTPCTKVQSSRPMSPRLKMKKRRTSVYNPEHYTSESPAHDDTPAGSTSSSHTSTRNRAPDTVAATPVP